MTPFLQFLGKVNPASTKFRLSGSIHLCQWLLLAGLAISTLACNSSGRIDGAANRPKTEAKVILPAQQVSTPANVGYVYDNEDLFTPSEEKKLDSLSRIFEKSNLIPIKLVTISDPAITVATLAQYNKTLLEEWSAVHGKSDKCMVISISKNLQLTRVDYGPFVSRLLSDNEVRAIVENQFSASFKQNQFYQGSWNGLNALMDTIRRNIKF